MQTQKTDTTLPRAYLNYLMFDEGFNMLPDLSGAIQVEQANAWQNLDVPQFEIPQNGYLYIFTSNQSQTTVSTDNLYLYHWQSRLLEEFNYYPFGLTFEVTHAQNLQGSDVRYNSQSIERNEFTDNANAKFGLNWYDFMARSYDVQIGRWMQPDPMMQHASPYLAMANNPTSFTDPLGLTDEPKYKQYNNEYVHTEKGPWWFGSFKSEIHGKAAMQAEQAELDFFNSVMPIDDYSWSVRINYAPNVVNHYRKLDQQNADRAKLNSVIEHETSNRILNGIQTGLDVAGLIPGFGEAADGLNALIYLARGDYANAGLSAAAMVPLVGGAAIAGKYLNKVVKLSDTKTALKQVHEIMGGPLPKGEVGKFGSPQRGTSIKGYRLDPAHPGRPAGHPESVPHINYWDYTGGKRGKGGIYGAIPIIKP